MSIDCGALAMLGLEGLAKNLRDREPGLSKEQSFARVYADPAYAEFAKIERQASRERISGFSVARLRPQIVDPDDDDDIARLIAEIRASEPFISGEELYSRIRDSQEERGHRAAFRRLCKLGTARALRFPRRRRLRSASATVRSTHCKRRRLSCASPIRA